MVIKSEDFIPGFYPGRYPKSTRLVIEEFSMKREYANLDKSRSYFRFPEQTEVVWTAGSAIIRGGLRAVPTRFIVVVIRQLLKALCREPDKTLPPAR